MLASTCPASRVSGGAGRVSSAWGAVIKPLHCRSVCAQTRGGPKGGGVTVRSARHPALRVGIGVARQQQLNQLQHLVDLLLHHRMHCQLRWAAGAARAVLGQ